MADSNFKPLQIKKFQKNLIHETPENKFWKKFDNTYPAAVNYISSNQNIRQLFSYSDSKKVEIFSTKNKEIKQTISNIHSNISGLCFRRDGNIVAISESTGQINIFQISKKFNLRTFKNHKNQVCALSFQDLEFLFSGGDDKEIRLFDIAANSVIRSMGNVHEDFIRSIKAVPNMQQTLMTSSYDGKVKIFDMNAKNNTPVSVFEHGDQVQDISINSQGLIFVSVGGTLTKFWDIRSDKPLETIDNNQKTITKVQFLSSNERVATSSLDQQIKIYRTDTFQVSHQMKFQSPVMTFDFTSDQQNLAVGMSDGNIIIKQNLVSDLDVQYEEQKYQEMEIPAFFRENPQNQKRIRNYKYFYRGIYSTPTQYDLKFEDSKPNKISRYDKYLKKFQYKEAMMEAIEKKQSDIIISLAEELLQRNELQLAFANLDEKELEQTFQFLAKKIKNPKFSEVSMEICNILLDNYSNGMSDYIKILQEVVNDELQVQKDLLQLKGAIELIQSCQ